MRSFPLMVSCIYVSFCSHLADGPSGLADGFGQLFFVGLPQSAERQVQAKRCDYGITLPDGGCESGAGAVQVTVDGLTADICAAAVPCLALSRCQEPDLVFFRQVGQQFENLNFLIKFTLVSLLRFFRPVLQEFQNLSQGLVAGFNR